MASLKVKGCMYVGRARAHMNAKFVLKREIGWRVTKC
jgi:hypothetical protein